MLSIEFIEGKEWIQQWAGNWCPLSCSYFGHQYTQTMADYYGQGLHYAIFISKREQRNANLEKTDLEKFGQYLTDKTVHDKQFAIDLAEDLKRNTDNILGVIKKLKGRNFSWSEYQDFLKVYYSYVNPHVGLKRIVDFLPPKLLDELLPILSEARVYAEPVYKETEEFTVALSENIGKKTNYSSHLLLCLVKEELEKYFKSDKLPQKGVLEKRYEACSLLFRNGVYEVMVGNSVNKIEEALNKQDIEGQVKGMVAHPGKVTGKARLVFDPSTTDDFNKGDILITGMTRPEFMPLIKRAGAVVTDAGGVLSHAAIVARELKKATVIGTERATKVFKDGDEVEVDAEKGVVKKLNI